LVMRDLMQLCLADRKIRRFSAATQPPGRAQKKSPEPRDP
jgi:hypothetical protein